MEEVKKDHELPSKEGKLTSPLHKELDNDEEQQIEKRIEIPPDVYSFSLIDLRNIQILRVLQYFCVFISGGGIIYFLCIGYLFVALAYFQVCFIASLVIALDNVNKNIQRLGLFTATLIAIGWGTTYFITNTSDLPFPLFVAAVIITSIMPITFLGGLVGMAYVITEISSPHILKCVELDLMLYLISLTAICFFSRNEFNNNLHMILDIRLMVTLYSGLYQEKDKVKLLRVPSFLINMLLIIISFIFFAMGYPITQIIGNSFYIMIGSLFFSEAYYRMNTKSRLNSELK